MADDARLDPMRPPLDELAPGVAFGLGGLALRAAATNSGVALFSVSLITFWISLPVAAITRSRRFLVSLMNAGSLTILLKAIRSSLIRAMSLSARTSRLTA